MRSTMISRCSSPMPLMIVCAVSGSECTRNVGSSSESFASAMPSLSWSALVFGSIATEMTGFGKRIASRMIGCASSHSMSPVRVSLRQMPFDRRNVHRGRQIIDDGVQQCLHALVFECGAADDGDDVAGDRGFANDGTDFFFGQLVVFEILVQNRVV